MNLSQDRKPHNQINQIVFIDVGGIDVRTFQGPNMNLNHYLPQ